MVADMSNVVNLTVAELTNNIVIADNLIALFANEPEAKAQIEEQRAVLVEELKTRTPPPATVGVKTLQLTAKRG